MLDPWVKVNHVHAIATDLYNDVKKIRHFVTPCLNLAGLFKKQQNLLNF